MPSVSFGWVGGSDFIGKRTTNMAATRVRRRVKLTMFVLTIVRFTGGAAHCQSVLSFASHWNNKAPKSLFFMGIKIKERFFNSYLNCRLVHALSTHRRMPTNFIYWFPVFDLGDLIFSFFLSSSFFFFFFVF